MSGDGWLFTAGLFLIAAGAGLIAALVVFVAG